MTPKQLSIMRGFAKYSYFQLSASEAGDAEVQQMFDDGIVESFLTIGGYPCWCLTHKGGDELVSLGLVATRAPVRRKQAEPTT